MLKNLVIGLCTLALLSCGGGSDPLSLSKLQSIAAGNVYNSQFTGNDSNGASYTGSISTVNRIRTMFGEVLAIPQDLIISISDASTSAYDLIDFFKVTGVTDTSNSINISNDVEDDVPCPENTSYTFTTQDDVDNFGQYYCNKIQGSLTIGSYSHLSEGNILSNLNGLKMIKSVAENLSIINIRNLTNIDALSNLVSVGGNLDIRYNHNLTNVNGLGNLESIHGSLTIGENLLLTDIKGISKVRTIFNSLTIFGNPQLYNLDGLNVKHIYDPIDRSKISVFSNDTLNDCPQLCPLIDNDTENSNVIIYRNSGICKDRQSVLSFCADEALR